MAEQITENLWRLDIPLVGNPLKNLNSYLIVGQRSMLIDTGFRQEPCRAAMEHPLPELGGVSPDPEILCCGRDAVTPGLSGGPGAGGPMLGRRAVPVFCG